MKRSKAKSNTKLSSALLAVAGFTAIFIGFKYLTSSKETAQPIGINEVAETQSPVFGLVVNPESTPLDLNFKTPVKIMLNAGQTMQVSQDGKNTITGTPNKLIAATIEFTYDPNQLTITDLVKGDYFPNTLAAPVVDPTKKKVTMSFGVVPGESGKTGSGVVATFNVQPKVAGKSVISFGTYAPTNPTYTCQEPMVLSVDKGKFRCAQPAIYRYPGIITSTDIRGENIDGNMYAASFNIEMRKIYTYQSDALSQTSGVSKPYLTAEPTYTFVTPEKTSSDIVDDSDIKGDQVNAQDYAQFVLDFNKSGVAGWIRSDIVKDGKVNVGDFATLVKEWSL